MWISPLIWSMATKLSPYPRAYQTYSHAILLYRMFKLMLLSCLPSEETSLADIKVETLETFVSTNTQKLLR